MEKQHLPLSICRPFNRVCKRKWFNDMAERESHVLIRLSFWCYSYKCYNTSWPLCFYAYSCSHNSSVLNSSLKQLISHTRYTLKLIVEDTTSRANFILFGHMASDLISVPANALAMSSKDKHEIPAVITKMYGLEKIFQVQLSNLVEDPSKITFKVIYIFKDDLLTPKKEIPSPASAQTTKLISPMPKYMAAPTAQKSLQFDSFASVSDEPDKSVHETAKKKRRLDPNASISEK